MALILSILLPGVLFIASMLRLLGCLKRRSNGAIEYVWATGYAMVSCLAAVWLAADLASIGADGLSKERAQVILTGGPSLFVSLGLLLVLRPMLSYIFKAVTFVVKKLRALISLPFSRRKLK